MKKPLFSGMLQDNRLTRSSSCISTELHRKPIWPSAVAKGEILSAAARAGCPLRSAQWSFIVVLSSVMLQRGVSGGLASGGTCQGVRVWTRACWTDAEPLTEHASSRRIARRGQLVH